mgnify:CR=1 FL=1
MDDPIRFGGIYLWRNRINGKEYIGLVRDGQNNGRSFIDREKEHRNLHKYGDHLLYRAMRKHGIENFEFSIIESYKDWSITPRELDEREIYHIAERNTFAPRGYNLTRGGQGCVGMVHGSETRLKISEGGKNRFQNPSERLKSSTAAHKRWSNPEERHKNGKRSRENYQRRADEDPMYRSEISRGHGARPFLLINVMTGARFYKDPDKEIPWVNRIECAEVMELGEFGAQGIGNMLNPPGHRKTLGEYIAVYTDEDPNIVEEKVKKAKERLEYMDRRCGILVYEVNVGERCDGNYIGRIATCSDIVALLPNATVEAVRGVIAKRNKFMSVDGKCYTCVPENASEDEAREFIERAYNPHDQRPFRVYDRRTLSPVNEKIYFNAALAGRDIFPDHARVDVHSQISLVLRGECSYVHHVIPVHDDLTPNEIKAKLEAGREPVFIVYKYNPAVNQWALVGEFSNQYICQKQIGIPQGDISHVLLGKGRYAGDYFFTRDRVGVDEKLRAILKDHRFCGWSRKFHLAAAYVREHGVQPKHDIVSVDVHGVKHKIGRWLIDQRHSHKKGTLDESRVKMLKHAGLLS